MARRAWSAWRSPVGEDGRFALWLRELTNRSGVYAIRAKRGHGRGQVLYVGESHTDRLYSTITRHLQTWERRNRFWARYNRAEGGEKPGQVYDRDAILIAVHLTPGGRAMEEQAHAIDRLRPRDNEVTYQTLDGVPF